MFPNVNLTPVHLKAGREKANQPNPSTDRLSLLLRVFDTPLSRGELGTHFLKCSCFPVSLGSKNIHMERQALQGRLSECDSYTRVYAHASFLSLSHTHTNPHNRVVPSRQLPSESCVCSRAPSPSRGYLFPVRGGRVAELRSVLGAAGLL